jgi:hypothetical protein
LKIGKYFEDDNSRVHPVCCKRMKEFRLIKTPVIILEFIKCTNWEQNEKKNANHQSIRRAHKTEAREGF